VTRNTSIQRGFVVKLPHEIVGHPILRIGIRIVDRRRIRIDQQREQARQQRAGFTRERGVDKQITTVELHDPKIAAVQRFQLRIGHVHAADLSVVVEVAHVFGVRCIQRFVLEKFGNLCLRFALDPRRFLLQPLGFDALVLFLLRANRVGLGEIDLLSRALRWRIATRPLDAGALLRAWPLRGMR